MSTTWHVDPSRLEDYVDGRLDALAGASVEQHLLACPDCRSAVTPLVEAPALTWSGTVSRPTSSVPPSRCRSGRPAHSG